MNFHISCDICRDLIPLVLDGISSGNSRAAVEAHTACCPECRALYSGQSTPISQPDDKVIWGKIQKRLSLSIVLVIIIGTAFGLALSNSFQMFYNILIMPAIGCLAFLAFQKKAYYWCLGLFSLSYLWLFAVQIYQLLSTGQTLAWFVVISPFFLALIYSFFFLLGVAIGHLLSIVFRKDTFHEN